MSRPGTLRIISGTAGGIRLNFPASVEVRPTADRVRESLFNILGAVVVDARVLDLFAGTGAFGIEALSRGAARAVFVEKKRAAAAVIRENLRKTHLSDRAAVITADAFGAPQAIAGEEPFSIIFLDPPYRLSADCSPGTRMAKLIEHLAAPDILAPNGMLILEHDSTSAVPESFAALKLSDRRRYGTTSVSIYA